MNKSTILASITAWQQRMQECEAQMSTVSTVEELAQFIADDHYSNGGLEA